MSTVYTELGSPEFSFYVCLFMSVLYLREREREIEWESMSTGKGRGRRTSRPPNEQGAQPGAGSQDPRIMTWPDHDQMINQLSHPGAPDCLLECFQLGKGYKVQGIISLESWRLCSYIHRPHLAGQTPLIFLTHSEKRTDSDTPGNTSKSFPPTFPWLGAWPFSKCAAIFS